MKNNTPELDKLFNEIGTYKSSKEYGELLNFIKKFPRMAPYNAMLVHIQKPGSTFVASAKEWKEYYSRYIKPGARPLVILRPFGPVAFVFEVEDTMGDGPLPNEVINPFKAYGKVSKTYFNNFIKNLPAEGIEYFESDHGSQRAGSIRTAGNHRVKVIIRGKRHISVKILCDMVVNSNFDDYTKLTTMFHEIGHMLCGHLGDLGTTWIKDRTDISLNEKEFEAESICWIISERLGLDNPSAMYLSGYLNSNETIPDISLERVLQSAAIIESFLKSVREPRDKLVLDVYKE